MDDLRWRLARLRLALAIATAHRTALEAQRPYLVRCLHG